MPWREAILKELLQLGEKVEVKKTEMLKATENLDNSKARDAERRRLILKEIRSMLRMLSEVDRKVSVDIKCEAFDSLRTMCKLQSEIEEETRAIKSQMVLPNQGSDGAIPNLESGGEVIKRLNLLKSRVSEVEEVPELEVAHAPGNLPELAQLYQSTIYLRSQQLDAKHFRLDCSSLPKEAGAVIEVRLHLTLPTRGFSRLVNKHLRLLIYSSSGQGPEGRKKMVEASAGDLLKRGGGSDDDWTVGEPKYPLAFMQSSRCLVVQLLRPHNAVVSVEASVFQAHVEDSPRVLSFTSNVVEDSVLDITNRCFPDATAMAVRLEDLDEEEQNCDDFYRRIMKTPNPMEFAPSLPDYEDSYPIYPTPSPILSPEKSTAGLGLPEIGHDCSKKAKTPRSSQTNGNLVTLDENDGEGPKKKFPRLDEPQINIAVVDEPGDDAEGGDGNGDDQEGGEGNPWDESCLPEDALSMLQQAAFEKAFETSHSVVNVTNALDVSDNAVDASVWGQSMALDNRLNFLNTEFRPGAVHKMRVLEKRTRSTFDYALIDAPYDIALWFNMWFVTEPTFNRVSMFSYDFKNWLGSFDRNVMWDGPADVLGLSNGFLVITDNKKLRIFDSYGVLQQDVLGRFHGLVEGENGDIFTLKGENLVKLSLGPTKKRWGKNGRRSNEKSYTEWSLTKLTVLSTFDNWEKLSKPRHLAYSAGKVYVTDRGLHKVLIVDLVSGSQSAAGYLGSETGKWRKPTGVLVDQVGHLLVVDQGNARLALCDSSGTFLRQSLVLGENVRQAGVLRMYGDELWLVSRGKGGSLISWSMKMTT